MKRLIILTALFASALCAETVSLTPTGKTFHKTAACAILKRSANKLTAERSEAEAHGLKPCRSCYSVHKSNNTAWARGAK